MWCVKSHLGAFCVLLVYMFTGVITYGVVIGVIDPMAEAGYL